MGCGPSKPKQQQPGVSAPQGGLELIPHPQRDAQGIPITHQSFDLDRIHLQRALGYAAEYLHQHGVNIVLITVGGAVNTILLQTRQTPHDVDFFLPSDGASHARLIEQASQMAEARASLPLGGEWLNNSTSLYISPALRQELNQAALQQNEIVFQQPGLTVFAAPWLYALCTKLQRLSEPGRQKSYDGADAATYLHRHMSRNDNRPLTHRALAETSAHYRLMMNVMACQQVNAEYEARYRRPGILF